MYIWKGKQHWRCTLMKWRKIRFNIVLQFSSFVLKLSCNNSMSYSIKLPSPYISELWWFVQCEILSNSSSIHLTIATKVIMFHCSWCEVFQSLINVVVLLSCYERDQEMLWRSVVVQFLQVYVIFSVHIWHIGHRST